MTTKKVFTEEKILKCPQCTFIQAYFKDYKNICTICEFKFDSKSIEKYLEIKKEYLWNCEKCTFENKFSSIEKKIDINNICCQLCNFNSSITAPHLSNFIKEIRNDNIEKVDNVIDVIGDDNVTTNNDDTLSENKTYTKWSCQLCTYENISSFNHCLVCQHLKDAEIDYNQISNDWKTAESYREPINCNRCLKIIYQKLNYFTKQKKNKC